MFRAPSLPSWSCRWWGAGSVSQTPRRGPWSSLRDQHREVVRPSGDAARARRGPACPLAHFPSALQALKKDDGVPWTGMLAIVHSYVTHKTGRTSSGRGRGHPSLQPHPQASGLTLGPSEAVLGPSSEQRELGAGPRCKAVTTGGWCSRPRASSQGHRLPPEGAAGTAWRHRPRTLPAPPAHPQPHHC